MKNLIDSSNWTGSCATPVNDELFTSCPVHLGFEGHDTVVAVVVDPADKSKFHVKRMAADPEQLRSFDIRTLTYDRWTAFSSEVFRVIVRALDLQDRQLVGATRGFKRSTAVINMFKWHVLGGDIVHGGDKVLVEEAMQAEYEGDTADSVRFTKCPFNCMAMVQAVYTATFYEEPIMRNDTDQPMVISYDERADVVTILGMKYTGEFFRAFASSDPGTWLRIVSRKDSTVTVEQPSQDGQVALEYAMQCLELKKLPERYKIVDVVTEQMVNRFLTWPLPKDFSPDCGVSFDGRKDYKLNKNKTWPTGTNLLTGAQACAMLTYILTGAQNGNIT